MDKPMSTGVKILSGVTLDHSDPPIIFLKKKKGASEMTHKVMTSPCLGVPPGALGEHSIHLRGRRLPKTLK